MIEVGTGQATYTLEQALLAIREAALHDPETWITAASERMSLELSWLAGATELDTPEALRVTRQYTAPVGEDLERIAAALPRELEIGPILPDPEARCFTLGLRPRTTRPRAERCPRCGRRPRYGTRLFGDLQRCAICTLWGTSAL
jgi:hypothetical protein